MGKGCTSSCWGVCEREREVVSELDYDKEAACKKFFSKIYCFTSPTNGPAILLQHCNSRVYVELFIQARLN